MKCPVDDSPLSISSREGIEIDFCPQCRGVWLDRGELDKIIERAANTLTPAGGPERERFESPPRDDRYERGRYEERRYEDRHHDDDYDHGRPKRKKKKSFLDDLFEFGE